MTIPSWQDLYDVGLYTLSVRRPSLIVREGDVTDAMVAGCATMGTSVLAYNTGRFKATFIDGAEGVDLTARSSDNGVDRDQGAHAIGTVLISRPALTAGAGTVTTGTRVATEADASGKFVTFTLDADVVFGALDYSKSGDATCSEIDVVGNVESATINRVIDLSTLWDQTLTVTNPLRFAAGAPVESDPDLRDRDRQFYLTQARGTIDALIYAAKLVPGVKRVSVVVDDSGVVVIYVADAEGNSNPAMAAAVTAKIEGPPAWRDAADIIYVVASDRLVQPIDVSLSVKVGADVNALLATVRKAIAAAVNRNQPGETLFREAISTAGMNVDPEVIKSCRVNNPPVDLISSPGQTIATDITLVTFS